ncbi:iron-sulfur cluster assembly accessory protein [Ornithinibacillus sp. L9]|uniref:Iron-sulfur cluster assembly accessory protein n=1 Tax=Ornithinibacillus caprae TaxID=2678566 RepID=A0A6N8FHT6_9BACI|nr:iron-sulfur cluster assembly accessory protein [Ornithinibacillus caprae]MUK89232.1 iron-sulfur cluster assembly accessory protein [Ornithinibacillus caprae]
MKCKINRNAAKVLKKMLETDEADGKMIRVFVTHIHGDHAHYDIELDTPTENDEVVHTDKDINIILEKGNEYLDGIWIQYFYVPQEEMIITNPKMVIMSSVQCVNGHKTF